MPNAARILAALMLALSMLGPAQAASLGTGIAAYSHQNFNAAAAIFLPLGLKGDARAQSYLGYMYSTGRGVPQNYAAAAYWYRRAADQG